MYDERAVSPEEAQAALAEIHSFIQRRFPEVACFMTTMRKDGRPSIRQVGTFVTGWTIETATQPWHVKNLHIRRNPIVTYLWVGLTPGEFRAVPNVMIQGTCEILEDPSVVRDFDARRRERTGVGGASEHERWLLRTTPTSLRAEGFTGPRRPVILTEFPL
ncbi:MAG: pyridoxamine 5'-phosphate oxidase family protein [Dehalococcoidia bacterium]